MSETLTAVWPAIKYYLSENISIIPIRDKDDDNGVAKSPFGKSWKPFTQKIISENELWHDMERFNTTAIGIICGSVSGNLEGIDADEKYMPGISARLFSDIKTLYPDLWSRLRIHGTPSKGFHILYRCNELIEGNLKLAGRYKTDAELLIAPRPKVVNFLETRGENGYVAAPPSLNYTIVQDVPIPVISKQERDGLINLCRSYTYITASTQEPYKPTARDNDYYTTNPFEDFNNRCNPSELMQELGWSEYKHNNKFIWYTRPGKTKGVSISFNIERRFYFCFTASTELEENHGYTPANLLSLTLHNGDKKKTYNDLVHRGYGVIKLEREEQIAKRAAINNKQLPPNASAQAISLHAIISQQLQQEYPYGIFWTDDADKGMLIDRDAIYNVSTALGFMIYNNELVHVINGIITEQNDRYYFDTLKQYIHEQDADTYKKIVNVYEPFIEHHGKFTISRLPILLDDQILTDTKKDCYKFYNNGVVVINKQSIKLEPYSDIKKFIWQKSIHDRSYNPVNTGRYIDFLQKAIGVTDFSLSVIGYLAHEFKDETTGYIIALPEKCENPEDGGGSGKNVFCKLFEHTTTFSSRSGEQISYDAKFLQSWKGEKIYCISDPPKDFRWSFLKDLSQNDTLIKKLFKDESVIKSKDMAKFILPTNFAVEVKDGGLARRIKQIEFTDFFTKARGVDTHYDCHFPNDWTTDDWAGYDYIITTAIKKWFDIGQKLPDEKLSDTGWAKQFDQNYGQVISGFIKENWPMFIRTGFITNEQFKQLKDNYMAENDIPVKWKPSTHRVNTALNEWSLNNGYTHNKDARDRKQLGEPRGHSFLPIQPPF